MLFLAADTVATLSIQWGNYLAPMVIIWILGCVIVWRVRRLHITATYVISFLAFALTKLDHRQSVAIGGRSHHRTDVSAFRILHDHRS